MIFLGTACSSRPDAPEPHSACSFVVPRVVRSELVSVAPDGSIERRPVRRPACFRLGRHGAVAWMDADGGHVRVGAHEERLHPTAAGDAPCLSQMHPHHDGFVVVGDAEAWRIDGQGRAPYLLPTRAPGEAVVGFVGDLLAVRRAGSTARLIDAQGAERHPVLLDDDDDPTTPARVQPLGDDVHGADWERRAPGIVVRARTTGEGKREFVVQLPGRALSTAGDVKVARGAVLRFRSDGVDEWRVDGADLVRVALQPEHDARGAPLAPLQRTQASFSWDDTTDTILVDERLRAPDCSLEDRLTIVARDGAARAVALPPAVRTDATLQDGTLWFVESLLRYEPVSDASGTNLP